MFDPWTADVEAVVAAQIAALRLEQANRPVFDPSDLADFCALDRCPLQQWRAAQRLLEGRPRIESESDRGAVVWAVESCLRHGLVAPEWLGEEFSSRLYAVSTVWATSWDDERAFGRPFPKGSHRDSLRRRYELAGRVYRMVLGAKEEGGRAIDKGLFEEIGAEVGIGATNAEEMYRSWLARDRDISSADRAYDDARALLRAAGALPSWWD